MLAMKPEKSNCQNNIIKRMESKTNPNFFILFSPYDFINKAVLPTFLHL